MSYNFLNYDGTLKPANNCEHDSNIGYTADFSIDGEVDGWEYYDGIHTYGCWNNFLFGTLYGDHAVIGRYDSIIPIPAEDFYTVKIVMKLNLQERVGSQATPKYGRLEWRTLSSPLWGFDKEYDFELTPDDEWHTYILNMGEVQWWQGDISDLRVWPILTDGRDEDEFYIRSIEVLSVSTYRCLNYGCSYYTNYEHPCPGIGERGYCKGKDLDLLVREGTRFEFAGDILYTIEEDVNDILYVNINEYGFENVVLPPMMNVPGKRLAGILAKEISKLDVGGYAECEVEYTGQGAIKIYAGNYADDSTVRVGDSQLAKDLNFRDRHGNDISEKYIGSYPATGFRPLSSFKIKTHQVFSLLDASDNTNFFFNPFIYSIEGGRRDWLDTGLGEPRRDIRGTADDTLGLMNRSYDYIENANKTLIDFNHPFNASGRITKVYVGCTLDMIDPSNRGAYDSNRADVELSGARVMFFRPLKNGDIRVLPMEIELTDRDRDTGALYSSVQEYVELDCDLFVNKGDLIGIYNANIYRSRSISGLEIDALYYQIPGKASGDLQVDQPEGQGSSGLLMYARGNQQQNRLVLDMDLGKRINVDNIHVVGDPIEERLEYNVARCLDIRWEIDLFGEDHTTGYVYRYRPLVKHYYNHPNIYYGKECLTDGIKTAPDGLAADSFTPKYGTYYLSHSTAIHKKDGGAGMVLTGAKYFSVNGDCEWLAVYYHVNRPSPFYVGDFQHDPIEFTLTFPHGKEKLMHKSKIFFKERFNMRSFSISHYRGPYYTNGTSDDTRYDYMPYRTDGYDTPWVKIGLDGIDYTPEDEARWDQIDLYLAQNPCVGHSIEKVTGVLEHTYDEDMAYWDELGGLQYYSVGIIENNDQYIQATGVDWTIIEHEWPPIRTKGYRFLCDYHESTKICEFELFCVVENIKSSMGGSVNIDYSSYGDYWWVGQNFTENYGIRTFIGDTPQLARITISPITEISLSDIIVDVSYEDVFMGEKGCQHTFYPTDIKRGEESLPQKIDFKNVYGRSYDLYVNIASDELLDEGVIFYSTLTDAESINNPVIGPDAYYRKHRDYKLLNHNKNVAINCPTYALKNLLDGADAWYSHDREYSWKYWGKIDEGNALNFSNLPNSAITTVNLPVLIRSKWWKIGFYDPRIVMTVREVQVYFEDEEIFGINFYHHKDQDAIYGGNTDTAPHLQNRIVDGSYYILKGDHYIGFELPEVQEIDRVVIYHDFKNYYENSHDIAGIDIATALCIHGAGDHLQTSALVDVSYYEHGIHVVGSGIYADEYYEDLYYDFTEDFSDCVSTTETFDGPDIDTDLWEDIVNSYIYDGELYVSNSGIVGEVTTVPYYIDDFDVSVDISIDGEYEENPGWGCFLEAFTDEDVRFRVGYGYSVTHGERGFMSWKYDNTGVSLVSFVEDQETQDLRFRLFRDGVNISARGIVGGDTKTLGTTTALDANPVKFRLISDLSPLAESVTIGRFDNFSLDPTDADWGTNTDYSSSFTCTSGLPTSVSGGWGYYYNIGTADYSNAAGYKIPRIDQYQVDPLDQDYEFTFKFKFQGESFLNYQGNVNDDMGVSVGLLSHKVQTYSGYYRWQNYFTGAQVVLRNNSIGIATQNTYTQSSSSYTAMDTKAQPYFCKFTGDGQGTYVVTVWTDNWDGSNQVATITHTTNLTWEADKVGVGSGFHSYSTTNYTGRSRGWVSDFDFTCHKRSYNQNLGTGIKFSGFPDEHMLVEYANSPTCNIIREGFDLDTKRFTIDLRIKFNSLPANDGERAWIIGSWHPDQALSGAIYEATPSSWLFYIERDSGSYRLRFRVNSGGVVTGLLNWSWKPDMQRWYHLMLTRGPSSRDLDWWVLLRDGHRVQAGTSGWGTNVRWSGADVIVGKDFDGWMDEIRVSSDYDKGGGRIDDYHTYYQPLAKTVPTKQYERYYTLSLYDSSNNVTYGKNMDVDVVFDNTYSYHEPFSAWSEKYFTFFAVDFGQRHAIDIVRSFPINTSYQFTKTDNILYSDKDTPDPVAAFGLTEQDTDLNTDFTGQDYDYPYNFVKADTTRATSYMITNSFYQMASPNAGQEYSRAIFKPYLNGDFDVQIDFNLGSGGPQTELWQLRLQANDINESDKAVRIERSFDGGTDQYAMWVRDNGSWSKVALTFSGDVKGTLRLVRDGQTFKAYKKADGAQDFYIVAFYQMRNTFGQEIQLSLYTISDAPGYPRIENWWDNFIVNLGDPIYSTYQDARWMRIKMLNGDGVTRTIEKAGFYPDITVQSNPIGQYNCKWEELGSAVTSYAADDNIALGATVSGSSYVGEMEFEHVTDGIISVGDFDSCWGSDSNQQQWITIHLNEIQDIYRVVIYHGYDESDDQNLILDYKIEVSIDNSSFTTIFNITGNDKFKRIHDLAYPVQAKQVRMSITKYNAISRFVWTGSENGFQFWKGALLREIEVYKYYGFTVIDSETRPVIAINLQQNYFIDGHSIVGIDAENSEINWDNDDSNFAYCDSHGNHPQKLTYRPWGSPPKFDRWVAVKRNTATHYPKVPTLQLPYTDTPDFLKHLVVSAYADDMGNKPNPLEYPWMWRSTVSKLSSDYNNFPEGISVVRNLKIEYPAGGAGEHLYYIEGDVFGQDEVASWRDGFGFYLYIDNIDNLDTDYGYIYLGGFDYTRDRNPVIHRWNWSSISGTLHSGWNNLTLTFLYADEVIYSELSDPNVGRDPRRLWTIDWGKMGFVFRSKGPAMTMNIDGSYIERNHFEHGCFQGYGLYLHANDVMKVQVGEMDFHSGAIEFFIRPDWDWQGRDIYGEFRYRGLFHFGNVDNDVLGAIVSQRGIEVYYGNLLEDLNVFGVEGMRIPILDMVTHFAFVFSNDGTGIGSDRSTIRFYINNILVAKETRTWKVSDDKHFNFVFGGQGVLAQKASGSDPTSSAVDGVLSRLRIHNYCKLDYLDSLQDNESLNDKSVPKPSSFMAISKDNVTFHKVGSAELPFFFEDVPAGTSIPIWVKLSPPKDLSGTERRTGRLLGNWDIGV